MLSLFKLNELVDLVCVLFTPVQFSLIQDSVQEESEGEEDQWEEAVLGENYKEVEKNSLPVRVTRNEQYILVMTMCNMQGFSFPLSPLMSSLLKPVYCMSLLCSFK